jgi:hypothetical protein
MRKPGTDPDNVQMSDVLCDFCRREWTEEVTMVEGHQGSVICSNCLRLAHSVVVEQAMAEPLDLTCTMCLESRDDRRALDRDDPMWESPAWPGEAAICRRCIRMASGVVSKSERTGGA